MKKGQQLGQNVNQAVAKIKTWLSPLSVTGSFLSLGEVLNAGGHPNGQNLPFSSVTVTLHHCLSFCLSACEVCFFLSSLCCFY